MAKPKDFSDDLAVLDTAVKGEVDTILKLVREKGRKEEPRTALILPESAVAETEAAQKHESAPLAVESPAPPPRKPRRHVGSSTSAQALDEQVILENVTTRLRRQTNELLTEAALRQKLKKENPSTR